jgi:hypothetical protein
MAHVTAQPAQLRELCPAAPQSLSELIAECLRKDPAARPTARALAAGLRAVA